MDAEVNRGVLNQLFRGQTKATPMLIGRLCAVLDRRDATRLLEAYLNEVADELWRQQNSVMQRADGRAISTQESRSFRVAYPPDSEAA